ncbi:MAG TPA: nitroreductase/quinone reductase family protein [Anaerolineaceae bacterium]
MASNSPQRDFLLQQGFRYFNRGMVFLWRLGLGRLINIWPHGSGQIMVITHVGRRTGRRLRTPVNYAVLNGEIYCTAGFGQESDWYRNLRTHPEVEIWLPDSWYSGIAEDVTGCAGCTTILRQVLIASGFAARAAGIDPRLISDEELERLTGPYRLIQIHRTSPLTGPGGPGDLSWVWPLATAVLFLTRPTRRRRR